MTSTLLLRTFKWTMLAFSSLLLFSCGPDPDPAPTSNVADDFSLIGTWYFQSVHGEGTILGTYREDDDPSPEGYITFNSDGTGYSEFGLELLNNSLVDNQIITWERISKEEVWITEEDDVVEKWKLIRANEFVIEASWEIRVAESVAVLTATLTP